MVTIELRFPTAAGNATIVDPTLFNWVMNVFMHTSTLRTCFNCTMRANRQKAQPRVHKTNLAQAVDDARKICGRYQRVVQSDQGTSRLHEGSYAAHECDNHAHVAEAHL